MLAINILCLLALATTCISWGLLIRDIETTEKRRRNYKNEHNNKD